jgi:hypothetical protein
MTDARTGHSATLLADGSVLVAGGYGATTVLATAELYNSVAGTWSATGSMADARAQHTATLLGNGMVLVAGGTAGAGFLFSSAELYEGPPPVP